MKWVSLLIDELCCPEEVLLIRGELEGEPGLGQLEFDVFSRRVNIQHDDTIISLKGLIRRLAAIGMTARPWREVRGDMSFRSRKEQLRTVTTWLSGAALLTGIIVHAISYIPDKGWLRWIREDTTLFTQCFYGASIGLGMLWILPRAWRAALRGRPDMNLLMLVAVLGALVLGEWFEASMVTFLFAVSNWLEQWSMNRATVAMRQHVQQFPMIARCLESDHSQALEVPVEQVEVGTRVEVWTGEMVPLDGVVVSGATYINEATLTGESLPVARQVDDMVFAGTTNVESTIQMRTTRRVSDSTLSRTLSLVSQARSKQAPIQRWVDRFAFYYTPLVMLLALLLMVIPPLMPSQTFDEWFKISLVVLVVACPCALVISTPVAVVVAMTACLRRGVLVRGGQFMEAMASIEVVCLDKTGTLTTGKPVVEQVHVVPGVSTEQMLSCAAALEMQSLHPLAKAIVAYTANEGHEITRADEVETRIGMGVRGLIQGESFWAGSLSWAQQQLDNEESLSALLTDHEATGMTTVAVGQGNELLGLIDLMDPLKMDAQKVISDLQRLGVKKTIVLSGDREQVVDQLAGELGIEQTYAALLPQEKLDIVEQLVSNARVLMVGDGLNDAPSLARAHVGIAIGAMGIDMVMESADITLLHDDLGRVPWLIRYARRMKRTIRNNILFALIIKIIVLGLAMGGFAHLWLAVLADTGATLLVVLNSLRLLGAVDHD